MANTPGPEPLTPIPLCAGCGRDSVSPDSCLCTLCTAHLATSRPIAWARPTACVATARTMAQPALTHLPTVVAA